jgi:hypothetical protein
MRQVKLPRVPSASTGVGLIFFQNDRLGKP